MFVPHLFENTIRSGLTFVSSNQIITIKINNKNVKNNKQTKKMFKTSKLFIIVLPRGLYDPAVLSMYDPAVLSMLLQLRLGLILD